MKNIEKISRFICLFISFSIYSQETIKPKLIDSLEVKAEKHIGKDNLKTDYFAEKNTLKKLDKTQEYQYQNLTFGKIEKVCIINPLQIVIFYEDFNKLILLDNQLNETQQIDGDKLEVPVKVEAFGLAGQNQVWLYDGFLQKISLYNFKSNTNKVISTPLKSKIKEYNNDYNFFYWIDETNTFYSISIFGKIKKLATIPNYDAIQIIDESKILILKNNELYYVNIDKASEQKIDLVNKSFSNFFYSNGILSIFTNNQIINYKIELP
jgi:hypothetical protein